jgi:thiol-disulfide isomerase/thioredoxin
MFSCSKSQNEPPVLEIKHGIAKIKGIVANYPIEDNVFPVFTLTVKNPISNELRTYQAQMQKDGSFSFEVPVECNVLASIDLAWDKLLQIFLIPDKETIIDIEILADKTTRAKRSNNLNMTNNDLDNITTFVDSIITFQCGEKSFVAWIAELQHYIMNSNDLSLPAKNLVALTFTHYYFNDYLSRITNKQDTLIAYSFLKEMHLNDRQNLYSQCYSDVLQSILRYLPIPAIEDKPIKEWLAEVKPILSPLVGFNSGLFYDMLAAEAYILQLNSEAKSLTKKQKDNIKQYYQNQSYIEILFSESEKLDTKDSLSVINLTPTFSKGELLDSIVSQYRGKAIVVDFWATWCVPCLDATEKMKQLKEEFQKEDVVFVYITSSSSPKGLWQTQIDKMKGEHYYLYDYEWKSIVNSNKYGFKSIPTYIIFDKSGNFKDKITGYPGNDAIRKMITELLN